MSSCLDCPPCRYFLTLPEGAPGLRPTGIDTLTVGDEDEPFYRPNGILFTNRHTYGLSTIGSQGELEYFQIVNRRDFWMPKFTNPDDVLTERGIFSIGSDPIMVKPSMRQLTMDVRITGTEKKDWECIRQEVGYMLSWEHATSVDTLLPTNLPSPVCPPNPWTLTYQCYDCEGELVYYHADIMISWITNDGDNESSNKGIKTEWVMVMTDPRFYGTASNFPLQAVVLPEALSTDPPSYVSAIDTSADPTSANIGVNGRFRYSGTARGDWILSASLIAPFNGNTITLKSIVLVDDTALSLGSIRWRRFQHRDYETPGAGWTSPTGDEMRFEFDTERQRLRTFDALGNVLEDNLQIQANAIVVQDWGSFKLIPGRVYYVVIEAETGLIPDPIQINPSPPDRTISSFIYTPRYGGY